MPNLRNSVGVVIGLNAALTASSASAQSCGYLGWVLVNPNQLVERYAFQMVYEIANERILIFGGARGIWPNVGLYNDTLRLDGNTWVEVQSTLLPVGRVEPSFCYDSLRNVSVMTGGANTENSANHHVGGTFEIGPSGWILRTMGGVNARHAHNMAFDSNRGRIVLFGGKHIDPGTWEWDGVIWRDVTPATPSPPSRNNLGFAFDESRGKVVMYGGGNATFAPIGDTWEWDGTNWQQILVTGPTARLGQGMVYDSYRRRIVLHAGQDHVVGRRNDTWEFDGTTWTQRVIPGPLPPPRQAFGFAYDRHRNRFIVAGGLVLSGGLADTWELRGDPYVQRPPSDTTVSAGETAAFDVGILNSAPFAIRWHKDGSPLSDNGRIFGSASVMLTILDAGPFDAGEYSATLTTACGSFSTAGAMLTVRCPADFNEDGGIDGGDVDAFFAQWENGNADFNQDGGVDGGDVIDFFDRWESGC